MKVLGIDSLFIEVGDHDRGNVIGVTDYSTQPELGRR